MTTPKLFHSHLCVQLTRFAFIAACCVALTATTQAVSMPLHYEKISAGTGFIINEQGDLITNAHVVRQCESIALGTDHGDVPATLIARDEDQDLAVLRMPADEVSAVAPLRWNIIDLRVGDEVAVIGFPGQAGLNGHYQYRKSTVTSLQGPGGESRWIQLRSVAQQGNSGGPVLDAAGNVIAVISGNAMTYRVDAHGNTQPQLVGQSDVAITLPALQEFLSLHQIPFHESSTGIVTYADSSLEAAALQFIVSVRCNQGATERP